MDNPQAKALAFRSLHQGPSPLALANVWDAASARLVEDAGALAIATTSAGAAWGLGVADGGRLDAPRALELVARVVSAVRVPVTADIEGGYADSPDGVGKTVEGVLAAGAVGVNIEDALHTGPGLLRAAAEQGEFLAAARAAADSAGVPLFINARIDTYLRSVGDPATRLRETLDRASVYVAAGADGIFVPGVSDTETVTALAAGLTVPLNVMAGPGSPSVAEFGKLGVARVSLGSAVAQAAFATVRRSAQELFSTGTYTALADAVDYSELNALLQRR
ncbi:isocitrate lyase/phosphoenolpyruvate mutase family protein [Streptomyces sp. ISL-100]|uniref:isocitrate lyase/PEP mutase family protein n=1 Tax=Streptomyces sp. ISL-100 TaxID=2819173 RepID=UPI001BE58CD9|nr:isocitrate lyase/phosphoenolpyruvate mutase family protein [Streptomyces sp. ISL-100]MBT2400839.1 isocitrate lyase/phosphoenolpyruvate mutase family protein [Streptomyces sp. ISL-100]